MLINSVVVFTSLQGLRCSVHTRCQVIAVDRCLTVPGFAHTRMLEKFIEGAALAWSTPHTAGRNHGIRGTGKINVHLVQVPEIYSLYNDVSLVILLFACVAHGRGLERAQTFFKN